MQFFAIDVGLALVALIAYRALGLLARRAAHLPTAARPIGAGAKSEPLRPV